MSAVFAFSAEQEEFRAMVRRFVEAHSAEAAVRAQMETERGFDPALWSAMAEPLGLQGLIVPEAFGGQGFGAIELGIVLEEMGRSLLCAPYFSTVALAVQTLLLSGDAAAQRALPAGHRGGRDDRHLGVRRAERALGRFGRRGDRARATARRGGSTARSSTSSTGTPPTSCSSRRARPRA